MSDVDNAPEQGGDEAAIESILGKLGDFDDEGAATEEKSEGDEPEESGPETATADDEGEEEGQGDPETPVIAPPDSWPAEARAKFSKLPSDLQAVIAEREREQKSTFNRQINEAAESKKAAESERQRLAQQAENYIQLANTLDPILQDGATTDWTKLASEDPALYVQKWALYSQRYAQVQAAIAERQTVAATQGRERLARERESLLQKRPELNDQEKGKAFAQEIHSTLTKLYGFTTEELKGASDHRMFLVVSDAAKYHKLMAERKSAADKKVVPITKVQKPGAGSENLSSSDRIKAMKQRAAKTDNLHDRAALIAAALD